MYSSFQPRRPGHISYVVQTPESASSRVCPFHLEVVELVIWFTTINSVQYFQHISEFVVFQTADVRGNSLQYLYSLISCAFSVPQNHKAVYQGRF